jgi:hypothetical protein
MSSLQEIALVVIGVLLIVGIGMWIASDARDRAPVADPDHPDGPEHPRRSEQQRARDRAKAKRARQARKANRHR